MKVKMREVFQGRDVQATLLHEGITVSILEIGESYEVDKPLGEWLIENGKAERLEEPKPAVVEIGEVPQESQKFEKPQQRSRREK